MQKQRRSFLIAGASNHCNISPRNTVPPSHRLALASVACNTSVPGQCPPGDQVCFSLALQRLVQQHLSLQHPVCNTPFPATPFPATPFPATPRLQHPDSPTATTPVSGTSVLPAARSSCGNISSNILPTNSRLQHLPMPATASAQHLQYPGIPPRPQARALSLKLAASNSSFSSNLQHLQHPQHLPLTHTGTSALPEARRLQQQLQLQLATPATPATSAPPQARALALKLAGSNSSHFRSNPAVLHYSLHAFDLPYVQVYAQVCV